MTLSIDQLQNHLARRFPDVERVHDSVIRFTRRVKGKPFAVYYVGVDDHLPATREELSAYQDRIIGTHYFDGQKSLQWSNYFYFLVSDDLLKTAQFRKAKEVIEDDRTYARKFIITEADLDSAIEPPTVRPSESLPEAGILSTWMTTLATASLDQIIMSDESLRARLDRIESSSEDAAPQPKPSIPASSSTPQPFLRTLELKKFRAFPSLHRFDFGTVNLIVGVNGSGKTSLLEAIELLYCGKTKRNPENTPPYSISATFSDNRKESATQKRALTAFRQRNLNWYGQAEIKTNNLYLSFAQYNFLNTDAAVSLAESDAEMEENLSKLLVGPETSKIAREIERTQEKVSDRLRELDGLRQQAEKEVASIEKQLKDVATVKVESDAIFSRLEEVIRRVGWSIPQAEKDEAVSTVVQSLVEMESIASQAASIDWAGSPVSLKRLQSFSKGAVKRSKKAEDGVEELEAITREEKLLLKQGQRCKEDLKLAAELAEIVQAGLPSRVNERERLQREIATYGGLLAGQDTSLPAMLTDKPNDMTVTDLVKSTLAERTEAEKECGTITADYSKSQATREKALRLAEELRNVAAELLKDSPNPDVCPLCHSEFAPGELENHMRLGVDSHREAQAQGVISRLKQSETRVKNARDVEKLANWLAEFCKRSTLASAVTVGGALSAVRETQGKLAEVERSRDAIVKELESLESRKVSAERYDELLAELGEHELTLPEVTKEAIDQLCSKIDGEQKGALRDLEGKRAKANELRPVLQECLEVTDSDVKALKAALATLKERIALVESLSEKLSTTFESFPWRSDKPIVELVVEITSIRKVASDYQSAVAQERNFQTILATANSRKKELKTQLDELKPKIERLSKAKTVFDTIQNKYPLEGAMAAALKQNREGIETIFRRIHAPAEFSGLGSDIRTLIRKSDETEANLRQISTGQRAAFALSLFLAQNAQLRTAPPVLLIDDPIAHVDDLNSLSFLDYLREVVVDGKRQIFFATANEKLAVLFERKFDFLGEEEFRKYDLQR